VPGEYDTRDTEEEIADPNLRAGEIMMSNGETNFTRTCNTGSGPFATYSAKGWKQGQPIQILDVLRPVSGQYDNGDPAVNAMPRPPRPRPFPFCGKTRCDTS
jgi:hypothetical protein